MLAAATVAAGAAFAAPAWGGEAFSAGGDGTAYKVIFVFESDLGSIPLDWVKVCVRIAGSATKVCKVAAELPKVANPTDSCNATGGSVTFCNVVIPRGSPVGKVVLVSVTLRSRYCRKVVPIGMPVRNTGVGDEVIAVNRRVRGLGVTQVKVRCT